ncbi:MAG: helix-turn-helix transcriptional regulator [Acidimicrobiia bacterium]
MIQPEDLGARLRTLRRARKLSLRDVEDATHGEFKASALGAYERGQRAITIQRLSRILAIYGVGPAAVLDAETTIDLVALERSESSRDRADDNLQAELHRFVGWVRNQRRHPDVGHLRFRRRDAELIGALFGVSDDIVKQLVAQIDVGHQTTRRVDVSS